MSIVKLSRRQALQILGIGGGGLLLGGSVAGLTSPMPAWAQAAPENGGVLNLFVRVMSDGRVIITAHRSEMGQGIRTSLPQVVADEMDADWQQVSVEQAKGDQRYGDQNTDGSKSVRAFYEPMRQMGAAARQMLMAAAAKTWQVPLAECSTSLHRVLHASSGRSLGYGELAQLAATMPLPDTKTLALKKKAQFRYIGRSLPQVDNENIVRGRAVFGQDVLIPGMVYASIERAPVLGSQVQSLDDTAARKMAGVLDVITLPKPDLPVLFKHLPGVAVIANNTWSAEQARAALKIVWSESSHASYQSQAALQTMRKQVQGNGKTVRSTGSGRAGLQKAAKTHAATYTMPYLPHATLEPPCAVARIDGERCEIWAPVQSPQDVQDTVAKEFGFKKEQVIVNVTLLGGAFGRKSKPDFVCEAVFLARKLGKPVKVVWTRADDLQHDYLHAISAQHLQAGWNQAGQIDTWVHHLSYPTIASTFNAAANSPQGFELSLGAADIPFAIPHTACETSPAESHARIGWLRSVANIHQAFAIGSFVDELAHLSRRPALAMWLELLGNDRRHNPNVEGYKYGNYGESLDKYPIDIARIKHCLRTVVARAGVNKKLPKGQAWGIAVHRSFVSQIAVATRVSVIGRKLKVEEIHCVADCGQIVNLDRVQAQMEGAMIFGLSLALQGRIDFADGRVTQSNFHDMPLLRLAQCPAIHVHILPSEEVPGGVGEPGVPPVAPSLCNAIFAASGLRIRDLPIKGHLDV